MADDRENPKSAQIINGDFCFFAGEPDRQLVLNIPNRYVILVPQNEGWERLIQETYGWSRDLCSQFRDYKDYKERGIGVAVLHNGHVESGASSYIIYYEGIEIEIDTRKDYRRRGLALACGARLILECMERGLYPSWDAQNRESVALAEKLGYHFDREYAVFIIDKMD